MLASSDSAFCRQGRLFVANASNADETTSAAYNEATKTRSPATLMFADGTNADETGFVASGSL